MDKYTIQQGDTLSGVASKYGTTVQALQSANQISNPNLIKAGANLVIPSQSIKAGDISTVKPLTVPQQPQSNIDNFATSFNNQVTEAQGGVNTAQNEVSSAQQDLINLSKQLEGKTAEQIALENQAGIPQVNQELLGLQNEAQRLTTEYLNAIKQREAQGGVAAVVGADQKRIQAQASSDIGLLNAQIQAKSGQLQMAQNTVDRAIAIKYEPLLQSLETKKMFYEMNKDNLSRADKALLEAKDKQWTLQKTQIEKQMEEEKAKESYIIKASMQNAPADIISRAKKAKNTVDAVSILGEYAGDILDTKLKKAQIAKVYADARKVDTTSGNLSATQLKQIDSSPQGKKLVSLSNLYQLSNTYKKLVDTYGFKATGTNKTLLDNAYADLKIAYKEAANLGALTGPDVGIIEDAIKPSSGIKNYMTYKLSGGQGGVSAGIEQALGKARNEALQNYKQLKSRSSSFGDSEYVQSLITPFAKSYSDVDVRNAQKGEIIQTPEGYLLESLGGGNFAPL